MTLQRITLLTLPLALATAAAEPSDPIAPDPLLERSVDRLQRRADIRSRGGKHGEVRIVSRGGTRVVQTLLYTKLLRRVLAEIRSREHANWPATGRDSEASVRYLAALDRAERSIPRPRIGDRSAAEERRRPLLIEFVLSNSEAAVMLLEPRVRGGDDGLVIVDARLIERLDLPRDFVERDMRLITEEHFPSKPGDPAPLLAPPGSDASGGPQP